MKNKLRLYTALAALFFLLSAAAYLLDKLSAPLPDRWGGLLVGGGVGLGVFFLSKALTERYYVKNQKARRMMEVEDRDERTRYNTYRSRALTFRVLFCLNFVILAGCFIGWWRSGEQEVYIQTAVPCMVLFIVGWITRIASDFYYEFKG